MYGTVALKKKKKKSLTIMLKECEASLICRCKFIISRNEKSIVDVICVMAMLWLSIIIKVIKSLTFF